MLKVAVPAVLGQLSVALQGAGLVYTSGALRSIVCGILQAGVWNLCLLMFDSLVLTCWSVHVYPATGSGADMADAFHTLHFDRWQALWRKLCPASIRSAEGLNQSTP